MRIRLFALAFVLFGSAFAETLREAPEAYREQGEPVAREYCDACHAIGKTGASPNPKAPVFRTIMAKQPAGPISEDLQEGLKIGHATMPRIQLLADDVDALMSYLISIQETES